MQAYRTHNQTVLNDLEEGDMIEFPRGIYSHWAVYAGNGQVVHITGDGDAIKNNVGSAHVFTISGVQFDKAKVVMENFWNVVENSKAKRNNEKDGRFRALSKKAIVEKAKSMIGPVNYNLLFKNCEHFASFCRYGKEESEQGDLALGSLLIGGLAVLVGVGVAALFSDSKKNKEKKL